MHKALENKGKVRVIGVPKLEDANWAGTKHSEKCTLILTEGDSAKALAMAGLEVVGRDYFGVFPLKGKFLNVREATNSQIAGNKEIQALVKIIGLDVTRPEQDVRDLRYGAVVVMADQDHDGSHIKGLFINFVHYFWPGLCLRAERPFLKHFITPLIKVFWNGGHQAFFSQTAYKLWCRQH